MEIFELKIPRVDHGPVEMGTFVWYLNATIRWLLFLKTESYLTWN